MLFEFDESEKFAWNLLIKSDYSSQIFVQQLTPFFHVRCRTTIDDNFGWKKTASQSSFFDELDMIEPKVKERKEKRKRIAHSLVR